MTAAARARRSLDVVREQLAEATAAKKCHSCGCFQQAVAALAASDVAAIELVASLDAARDVFVAKRYDCLGCDVCFPAVAANAFVEAFPEAGASLDLCPTEAPVSRDGWPPLPGDYAVLRYGASVAVCTLNTEVLVPALSASRPRGLAIIGTLHTENLGIERLVQNVVANPNIRWLVLCGEDTRQAVGHLPGQTLESLVRNGIDGAARIVGASGRRPVLKNLDPRSVAAFREQIELVALVGVTDPVAIARAVERCADQGRPPFIGAAPRVHVEHVQAVPPRRLVPDPAGYVVVYPDHRAKKLRAEHFTNAGVLTVVVEGATPAAVYASLVERGLVSRLDHAAYLGRELARAESSLATGGPYVQDRAAGELDEAPVASCCSGPCGSRGAA